MTPMCRQLTHNGKQVGHIWSGNASLPMTQRPCVFCGHLYDQDDQADRLDLAGKWALAALLAAAIFAIIVTRNGEAGGWGLAWLIASIVALCCTSAVRGRRK